MDLETLSSNVNLSSLLFMRPFTALVVAITLILGWLTSTVYKNDQARTGAWGCEMSWMNPSYALLSWPERPSKQYQLYLYREQGWDVAEPTGHPVIFVPGNAGSHEQVRSIASSAARQHAGRLDFFTGTDRQV
jgi:glycosylphosphatidylinositol deacylase